LRYLDQQRIEETVWRVRFVTKTGGIVHQAQVASRLSEFQTHITCHSTEAKSVSQFQLEDYRAL
jgi:hypothetical protein